MAQSAKPAPGLLLLDPDRCVRGAAGPFRAALCGARSSGARRSKGEHRSGPLTAGGTLSGPPDGPESPGQARDLSMTQRSRTYGPTGPAGVSIALIGHRAGVPWPATPSSARQRRGGSTKVSQPRPDASWPRHRPGPGRSATPPETASSWSPGRIDVSGSGHRWGRADPSPSPGRGDDWPAGPAERDPAAALGPITERGTTSEQAGTDRASFDQASIDQASIDQAST